MKKVTPGPNQESVWDYPRPPRVEDCSEQIRVVFNGEKIARSERARRVLETSHPPVYYLPREDIEMEYLKPISDTSYCEWKGRAHYFDVIVKDQKVRKAAWSYPEATERFKSIEDYIAFYAHKMEACYVGEEKVKPQPGNFYGGWITSKVVGPFKGIPGSAGW